MSLIFRGSRRSSLKPEGQFTPQDGANPTIGTIGRPAFVEEDRVEIVMNDKEDKTELKKVVEKLKQVCLVIPSTGVNQPKSGFRFMNTKKLCIMFFD